MPGSAPPLLKALSAGYAKRPHFVQALHRKARGEVPPYGYGPEGLSCVTRAYNALDGIFGILSEIAGNVA